MKINIIKNENFISGEKWDTERKKRREKVYYYSLLSDELYYKGDYAALYL